MLYWKQCFKHSSPFLISRGQSMKSLCCIFAAFIPKNVTWDCRELWQMKGDKTGLSDWILICLSARRGRQVLNKIPSHLQKVAGWMGMFHSTCWARHHKKCNVISQVTFSHHTGSVNRILQSCQNQAGFGWKQLFLYYQQKHITLLNCSGSFIRFMRFKCYLSLQLNCWFIIKTQYITFPLHFYCGIKSCPPSAESWDFEEDKNLSNKKNPEIHFQ